MTDTRIYDDIALRTNGDIYLGVVGPVRTGKSTFIKRFMETLVIPNIDNVYVKERARDELPQSGSGRTIMTAEPKFVPEEAVNISVEGGVTLSVRLIDCVGYMVNGAIGQFEGENERMVTTPWFDHEIPMAQAAEEGTHKVINEHSTIGLVVTTDGSITDIPRTDYINAEERVVSELKAIGKPFVVILNSAYPNSPEAKKLGAELEEKYAVTCLVMNCLELGEAEIAMIVKALLYEFPAGPIGVYMPSWVDALPLDHEIKKALYGAILDYASNVSNIRDVLDGVENLKGTELVSEASVKEHSLGTGIVNISLKLPENLYYDTLSQQSGFEIRDDGDLMGLLSQLAGIKEEYENVSEALKSVRETGYGVVLPTANEMRMGSPEIVRHGGRYGVRLKASAPSIHMMMANIETEVAPTLGGGDRATDEIMNFLLQGFEGDMSRIWESNIFGKSLFDIAGDGLLSKINAMQPETQTKLRETLQRILNEGGNGLICIIL